MPDPTTGPNAADAPGPTGGETFPTSGTERELGHHDASGEARSILMRRRYDAEPKDVWDACTDPDRMSRFFMRPTGDLRVGGTFSFEGNAGGSILRCEPPKRLTVTWIYGPPGDLPPDQVELRLTPDGDGTVLELEHSSSSGITGNLLNDPERGLWGLGAGWELGLLGLHAYLRGDFPETPPSDLGETSEIATLADHISAAWSKVLDQDTRDTSPTTSEKPPGSPQR
ncbi:SRPBCC family protein [Sphaerisporangium corydalis]|uniref:SRPBCC family protein n=1 Tax=Sphaerisporangium corydalis TaxID=1441875 RepID=A0ABV9EKH3_9ACTN|nr:SRPBCC family protein [Sphaerisporangium corydalis]